MEQRYSFLLNFRAVENQKNIKYNILSIGLILLGIHNHKLRRDLNEEPS